MGNDNYSIPPMLPDNAKTLLDAGRAIGLTALVEHGGRPVVVIPERFKVHTLEMPGEKVGRVVDFEDVESFGNYVNRFITPGTLLFAEVTDTNCKVSAHLDYHDKPVLEGSIRERQWSSHVANLECVLTKEWVTWMKHNGPKGNNGEAFSQVAFAQFLEDNERVFRSPGAAELLELVTTLEGKNDVRFNQAVKLQNGKARLSYEEDIKLTGGVENGAIEMPTKLTCAIIPFENGPEPYTVESRLRFRLSGRQIVFWYETITPHLILRDAAKAVLDAVREKVKAPVLIGG